MIVFLSENLRYVLIDFLIKDSRHEYLKRFDAITDGPLHQQQWAIKEIQDFDKNIYSLKKHFCYNCHELWPAVGNVCQ